MSGVAAGASKSSERDTGAAYSAFVDCAGWREETCFFSTGENGEGDTVFRRLACSVEKL